MAALKPIATKLVVTDYWDEDHGHRPYRDQLRLPDDDSDVEYRDAIRAAIERSGAVDGDEIEIVVVKTGQRPFGNRRVRWVEPHKYARETNQEMRERTKKTNCLWCGAPLVDPPTHVDDDGTGYCSAECQRQERIAEDGARAVERP